MFAFFLFCSNTWPVYVDIFFFFRNISKPNSRFYFIFLENCVRYTVIFLILYLIILYLHIPYLGDIIFEFSLLNVCSNVILENSVSIAREFNLMDFRFKYLP